MASTKKPAANDLTKDNVAASAAARNTDSGPAHLPLSTPGDAAAQKIAAVQEMVGSMPFNANKPLEHGYENALNPPVGLTVEPTSLAATGSTLSEENMSEKVGSMAAPGINATIESLDRVRVDATGQVLTTNQGVAIADNQNSLKAGLRGPALLEDFILREKITHFDHERIPERIVHARGSGAHGFFEIGRAHV